MKKILVMMAFVVGMLFVVVDGVKASDCPTGYSVSTFQITAFDCLYNVEICYDCSMTHPPTIQILSFEKDDNTCNQVPSKTTDEILEALEAYIGTMEFIRLKLCTGVADAPPCDPPGDGDLFSVKRAKCWVKDGLGNTSSCEDSPICVTFWEVCWSLEGYVYTNLGSLPSPISFDCEDTEAEADAKGSGYCFYVETHCD